MARFGDARDGETHGVFDARTGDDAVCVGWRGRQCELRGVHGGTGAVVPFHPKADWGEGDEAGDFTSKSPWATIHLLRQCDIDRAEESWYRDEGREDIRERNVEYLRALGIKELSRRFAEL